MSKAHFVGVTFVLQLLDEGQYAVVQSPSSYMLNSAQKVAKNRLSGMRTVSAFGQRRRGETNEEALKRIIRNQCGKKCADYLRNRRIGKDEPDFSTRWKKTSYDFYAVEERSARILQKIQSPFGRSHDLIAFGDIGSLRIPSEAKPGDMRAEDVQKQALRHSQKILEHAM